MLELHRLTVRDRDDVVLDAGDLRVDTGRLLGIAGSTAATRTAVLLAIAGRAPREGRVTVDGRDTVSTGLVTRDHVLIGSLTAVENVAVPLFATRATLASRSRRPLDVDRIDDLLATLQLPEAIRHNLVENLSGGQQQRVAVARAFVIQPGFVCLDDSVSELDGESTTAVRALIRAAVDAGSTVVTTVADTDDEAMCDQLLWL